MSVYSQNRSNQEATHSDAPGQVTGTANQLEINEI